MKDATPRESSSTVRVVMLETEKPGDRIGRYKLLEKVGEGGGVSGRAAGALSSLSVSAATAHRP